MPLVVVLRPVDRLPMLLVAVLRPLDVDVDRLPMLLVAVLRPVEVDRLEMPLVGRAQAGGQAADAAGRSARTTRLTLLLSRSTGCRCCWWRCSGPTTSTSTGCSRCCWSCSGRWTGWRCRWLRCSDPTTCRQAADAAGRSAQAGRRRSRQAAHAAVGRAQTGGQARDAAGGGAQTRQAADAAGVLRPLEVEVDRLRCCCVAVLSATDVEVDRLLTAVRGAQAGGQAARCRWSQCSGQTTSKSTGC
jgi:hypothetical protein